MATTTCILSKEFEMNECSEIFSIVTSQAVLHVFCKAVGFLHVELIILKVKQLEPTARN